MFFQYRSRIVYLHRLIHFKEFSGWILLTENVWTWTKQTTALSDITPLLPGLHYQQYSSDWVAILWVKSCYLNWHQFSFQIIIDDRQFEWDRSCLIAILLTDSIRKSSMIYGQEKRPAGFVPDIALDNVMNAITVTWIIRAAAFLTMKTTTLNVFSMFYASVIRHTLHTMSRVLERISNGTRDYRNALLRKRAIIVMKWTNRFL